jgi:two-component sensor histidine kinase
MSLVHRQLFRITRDDMSDLEAGSYLQGLARELAAAFAASDAVQIEVDAEEGLQLSPDRSVALGLLVTELVLNAMKHAFKDRDGGRIRIGLRLADPASLRLTVEDDGRGSPRRGPGHGHGCRHAPSGRVRAPALGHAEVEGPPGTRFVVLFPRSQQSGHPAATEGGPHPGTQASLDSRGPTSSMALSGRIQDHP